MSMVELEQHDITIYHTGGVTMATISFDREIKVPKENIDQLIDAMKEPSHAALDIPDVRNKLAESRRLLEHAARIDAITPRTLLG